MCMKTNLPVFKDEDAKDAVTYQSWRWDLTVYQHTGCRHLTLLPYAIRSLQGYPGELVQSSGTDITLDDVLTILDKHYNNVKSLDALNQELFQMQMADKETVSDWGVHLSRHLQILVASFPDCFPPDCVAELKRDCFYGGLPKQMKVMEAYHKAGPQVTTYSDYLRATREAEKEDSIELSRSSRTKTADGLSKRRTTSSFPLRKLKGNQPFPKKPTIWLVQMEEEDADNGEDPESDDPNGIKGVTEEFMVWLARAVKDTQTDEKHCYHCSSPEHFSRNCPLMKTTRDKKQLNGKEGMAMMKGAQTPPTTISTVKSPQGGSRSVKPPLQTPFLNPDPFQQWYGIENVAKVKINGESCMALLDNGAQVNTIMLRYVNEHSLQVGLITNLMGSKVACVGLGNNYTRPLGYMVIQVQVDGVLGYNEDQIALVIPDFSNFPTRVPIILGTPTIG